jgi:outer membrane cobalamin receptor
VALASGRAATVALVLDSRAATLGAVTVRGTRSRRGPRARRLPAAAREGAGQFLTAADLERMRTPLVSDALRTLPGVNVQHTGRGTRLVRLRGGCVPQVVLDGTLAAEGTDDVDALVRPLDVVGIEVYTDAAGLPAEWSGARTNSCGVVAIWTKI